jgi:hypothetical protein
MKKTIILGVILSMVLPHSFATNNPADDRKPGVIKSVEINADVTVVLGYYNSQQAFVDGGADFKDQIIIKQAGSHLVISSDKNRDLKSKGVIYISAESLLELRINSSAFVQSSGTLSMPVLNIFINGACELMIANIGDVNLEPSLMYDFVYKRKKEVKPRAVYLSRK